MLTTEFKNREKQIIADYDAGEISESIMLDRIHALIDETPDYDEIS